MRRPGTVTIVSVVAFLIAGFSALLVYNYLKNQTGKQMQGVAIVAAATDIPVGTKLEVSHLKQAVWPKEALASGYLTDSKLANGRVAVRSMSAGDVITEAKLMPQNSAATGGIMTYIVPQGHRAVTVAVNEVAGVAGFITPNSRVDIVLTTPQPGMADKDENISKIILQNVPVLASGQVTEQKEGKPVIVPTVTLDLTPDDAEKLIVGAKKGALQLLLRNIIDTASVTTKGATIIKALKGAEPPLVKIATGRPASSRTAASPVPAKVPAQRMFSMEIIKGGVKATREFPGVNE